MTARDIVTAALQRLNILGAGEAPTAEDATYALATLNELLDQYKAESLQIYLLGRTTHTLVSGTGAYTVGTGGNFNVERPTSPQAINQVNFIDTASSTGNEMILQPLTNDAYASLWDKTMTATYPNYWWFEPTFPLGTLHFWPIPNVSTLQAILYAPTPNGELATLSTTFSMPPGYRRMLITNLAVEMASGFEKAEVPQSLIQAAADSMAAVKRANYRLSDLSVDPGALGNTQRGFFNWRNGEPY